MLCDPRFTLRVKQTVHDLVQPSVANNALHMKGKDAIPSPPDEHRLLSSCGNQFFLESVHLRL